MYANKKSTAKLVALVLVMALLIGGAIGGTLAWLVTNTDPVVNTFTVGNINIELTETFNAKSEADKTDNDIWTGKMVPGTELAKDPKVTVKSGSEKCWVFVKVEKAGSVTVGTGNSAVTYDFDDFISFGVDSTKWTIVETNTNQNYVVYGYSTVVDATSADQSLNVLKDNQVNVLNTVTKDMMDAVSNGTAPELTFTAYAIQSDNLKTNDGSTVTSAADAWAVYQNPPSQPTN